VKTAVPLYVSDGGYWRLPGTGDRAALRVYGFDPDDSVLLVPGLTQQREALRLPGTVVFDDKSRPYFGKHDTGTETELNEHTVRVVGTVELGPDFTTDGNVFTGTATYFSVMAGTDPDDVGLGLVKVNPGTDPKQVQADLMSRLPPDLVVYTPGEFDKEIRDFFNSNGSTAAVFGLGVMIGFLIGGFICYQVLYTDVTDHLSQFATLKAVGYSNFYLMKVVAGQALILSVLGFVVGLVPAWLLCNFIENGTGLVMRLTPPRLATVFMLTVAMNQIAGVMAVRRVLKADPADLF
jgi:putative ABC transport system permease protein